MKTFNRHPSPGVYLELINYHRIKLIENISLVIITIVIISLVIYLSLLIWQQEVAEICIVGSGPYPQIFADLLEKKGIRTQVLVPHHQIGLTISVQGITQPYIRNDEINNPLIYRQATDTEIKILAERYDLPYQTLVDAHLEMINLSNPSFDCFFHESENKNHLRSTLYSLDLSKLITRKARRGDCDVVDISTDNGLVIIKGSRGETYRSRYVCLVESNSSLILDRYFNLDQPIRSFVSMVSSMKERYPPVSEQEAAEQSLDYNLEIGGCLRNNCGDVYYYGNKIYFSREGKISLNSKSNTYVDNGSFDDIKELTCINHTTYVKNLNFPLKECIDQNICVLDTFQLSSYSDLIIVILAIVKMVN